MYVHMYVYTHVCIQVCVHFIYSLRAFSLYLVLSKSLLSLLAYLRPLYISCTSILYMLYSVLNSYMHLFHISSLDLYSFLFPNILVGPKFTVWFQDSRISGITLLILQQNHESEALFSCIELDIFLSHFYMAYIF